jgi:hypothetical protein
MDSKVRFEGMGPFHLPARTGGIGHALIELARRGSPFWSTREAAARR